ncbi:3136_t:CDS:2, partial [Dentiscutata erythropus]
MDSSSESMNYEDTLVSSSADINENNLDCVVIPEICSQKRKEYTGESSKNIDDYVSKLNSEEIKNARITDHNNDTPDISVGSSNIIIKKKAEAYIDNIRYGVYNIEMANGEACAAKVKTSDSTMALWRHLNIEHGYTKNSLNKKQTTITKVFETSLSKLHNTTEQAICNKAITEVIVVQNLSLFFIEEKMFKQFAKIVDSRWVVPGRRK